MLKAGFWGLLALAVMALASYFYQASMIAHLEPDQYALVMVGLGSFLITTALGNAVEVVSVLHHGKPSVRGLAGLMTLAALLSASLALVGMFPLGVTPAMLLPIGFSAAFLVFFGGSLGAAQAGGRWPVYLGMALLYAATYAGLAIVCYDPFLALAIPGIAGALGGLPGLFVTVPNRFGTRETAPTAVRLAPIPLLVNLDLWLASHWLGPATAAYRVPALLGRPFFYLLGSGLAPAVRRAAASGRSMVLIALVSLAPLVAAPFGFVALASLRGFLPDPWGAFRLDLLAWAIFAQASVGSFYLLINGLGHRAGQRYALALLLLPVAFVLPPLAQILVATTGGILLLVQASGRAYLLPLQRLRSRASGREGIS